VTVLLGWEAPPGGEMLIAWLTPIGRAGAKRKSGDVLPYYMVNRVAGPDDKVTDYGTYSVHSFAASYTAAEDAARLAHRRILALGPPLAPQRRVTISGGRIVQADRVMTDQAPFWLKYSDEVNLERFVARYDIDLRFVAAA